MSLAALPLSCRPPSKGLGLPVLGAWFTLISRATGLRAAGVLGERLTDSHGSPVPFGLRPPRPWELRGSHRSALSVSYPSLGFRGANPRWLYRRQSLGWDVLACPSTRTRPCICIAPTFGGGLLRRGWRALSLAWRCHVLADSGIPPRRACLFPYCVFIIAQNLSRKFPSVEVLLKFFLQAI